MVSIDIYDIITKQKENKEYIGTPYGTHTYVTTSPSSFIPLFFLHYIISLLSLWSQLRAELIRDDTQRESKLQLVEMFLLKHMAAMRSETEN